MRRAVLSASALLLAAGTSVAVAATDPVGVAQRLAQGGTNQGGAYCRIVDDTDSACSAIDGRDISAAQVAAYDASWVHRALTLQSALSAHAPLIEDQIPHTHNSFNSSAYAVPIDGSAPSYYPTLTNEDPNQVYSLADQLNMDVRAIEIDLHWVPSPYGTAATHGYWVTTCHGDGQQAPVSGTYVHVGCTDDRPAQDAFAEVRRWLDAHPDQFVLVYLENQLYPADPVASAEQAHDVAAALLQQAFGTLVFRPSCTTPGHCATLPYRRSRAEMAATGARVLLVGNCGPGAWSGWVFQRGSTWDESGDPSSYSAADCARDERLRATDASFRREYEDSTFVSAATAGAPSPAMSPANVATMVRCGVNIIGMDQLRPQDGRLAALVWSWAPGEPGSGGDCALQGADGRFRAAACGRRLPAACRADDGTWAVTTKAVPWARGNRECAKEMPGSSFAVPLNGFRNAQLLAARAGGDVWLAYGATGGTWAPR